MQDEIISLKQQVIDLKNENIRLSNLKSKTSNKNKNEISKQNDESSSDEEYYSADEGPVNINRTCKYCLREFNYPSKLKQYLANKTKCKRQLKLILAEQVQYFFH